MALKTFKTLLYKYFTLTQVRWAGEDFHHAFATGSTYTLHLACADTSGALYVWDVVTGQVRTELVDQATTAQITGKACY